MAVKTYRLGAGLDGNHGALFEADQAAASRTDGWTVAKIGAGLASSFDAGTKQLSSTFGVDPAKPPTAFVSGTAANALKTPTALTGTFAATAWTLTFAVRATTASAQRGAMRLRVMRGPNADGSGATEITSSPVIGTTSAALSTTADVTTVVTWSPGAITLNNEFLFFLLAWEITTASGSNSGDVLLRTGQAAGGTRIVTPDFVSSALTYFGALAVSLSFGQTIQGVRKAFGALTRAFIFAQAISASRKTFGSSTLPLAIAHQVAGSRATFATVALPLTFTRDIWAVSIQVLRPDADLVAVGWTVAPLWSKLSDNSDASVISAVLAGAAATGPTESLLLSYAPGSDRNDFTGAVGVRLGLGGSDIPITWLGARCNGYPGTRILRLYEWFSGVVQRTATIDYTGKAVGEFAWAQIAPLTLLAGGYYAVLMDVTAYDGMFWTNPGPVAYAPSIVNIYDSYWSGGLQTGVQNSSFVGLDVGN